ncbi:hypothetical protein M3Y99_01220800 [Aphelenchoides fujianensis]|nr:hypothetical protein M3Y99_01220800 [Aphelenchoides fujianensis]
MEAPSAEIRVEQPAVRDFSSFGGFHVHHVCLAALIVGLASSLGGTGVAFWLHGARWFEAVGCAITAVGFLLALIGNRSGRWALEIPLLVLSTLAGARKFDFKRELVLIAAEFLRDSCVANFTFFSTLFFCFLVHLLLCDVRFLREKKAEKPRRRARENRYVCCGNLDVRLTNFSNIRVIHPSAFEVVTSLGFSTFILLTPLLLFIGNRLRIALFYVPAVHIARPVVFSAIVYLAVLILTMLPEVGKMPDVQHTAPK